MTTVLVTGGIGYKGSVLCEELVKNHYNVICYDNIYKGYGDSILHLVKYPWFEFVFGDITDEEALKPVCDRVDFIIHLAGIVGLDQCRRAPGVARLVNVEGTKTLLRVSGNKPIINAGTGSSYGKIKGTCTENSPCNPLSLYGITKLEAEYAVMNRGNSLSYRHATAMGVSPNMRVNLLINNLVYDAMTRKHLNIFQADFRRTFVSVRDMARGYIHAIENFDTMKNAIYNFGHKDLNWTKREVAEYIKTKVDCSVTYNDVMEDVDQRDYEVDYSKLYRTNFECKYSMEETIDELIRTVPIMNIRQYQ